MDYGAIISRAWGYVWEHKWLWALGFLAALSGGGGSGGGSGTGFTANPADAQQLEDFFSGGSLPAVNWTVILGALAALIAVLVVLGIIFYFIGLVARAGLVGSIAALDDGELELSLGSSLRGGLRHLWRLFGMQLLLFIVPALVLGASIALIFVAAGGLAAIGASGDPSPEEILGALGAPLLCLIPLICLFAIASFVLQLVSAFAFRGIVLRNLGVVESVRHGWAVVRGNLVEILLLGVIFTVIGWVYGVVVGLVVGLFALGSVGPLLLQIFSGDPITTGRAVLAAIGVIVSGILAAVLSSVLVAWRSATFTLAYRQFTGKAPAAKEKGPENLGYDPIV